jgi:hypothetical protein
MNTTTVDIRVGRLMEIVVKDGFRSVDDVELQRTRINEALAAFPASQSIVIAADWRGCQVMTQPAAAAIGPMIASFNDRIERSAILGSPTAPVAVLQFLRVARETKHPRRRVFEDRRAMLAYLSESLQPHERDRLYQFLPA